MRVIDLRSDTVTTPTPAMRRAMYEAEVGDDVYREDPTVRRLEELAAEIIGKEAALFVTSGTQGNQVAILTHTRRGDEVIVEAESHIFIYEVGGMAALAGCQARPLPGRRGALDPADVAAAIRPENVHFPRTGLVCLENTHNRAGGAVLPQHLVEAVAETARSRGVPLHLDGARIFNAAVATGRPAAELAAPADSVMFCLSKGLGAPVGSILAGSEGFIAEARRMRKLLGGGLRQAGVLAAAGIVALTEMVDRLAEDHENARRLAEGLAQLPGVAVDVAGVETNMVMVDVTDSRWTAATLSGALAEAGVRCNAVGPRRLRLVTHKDVSREDIDEALRRFESVLREAPDPARTGTVYG
ncbi:low-specificity L-threonine aldolase [Caldinitratiruptor microaerophilus]|uniref:Threonine aldolase n=1 Tax=Caldinitratiruptor microaerophilus TaxID=671077 RepID=A0AA35CIZ1_9FIRM|nr:low-specificity L-threonine aldolase [Caldinitratiruptor microaerophilus]BDG59334.1 threonine aldolase [Caldinitratiruptor microaerophilus]